MSNIHQHIEVNAPLTGSVVYSLSIQLTETSSGYEMYFVLV